MVLVASLRRYPVKALRGSTLTEAVVEPWGLAGDRRWMLVDAADRFLSQRQLPALAAIDARPSDDGLELEASGGRGLAVPRPAIDAFVRQVKVWRDSVRAHDAGDAAASFLTAVLGVACRLVHMAEPDVARPVDGTFGRAGDHVSFADGFPLLLTTAASLGALNERLAAPVSMERFRPNLVLEGGEPWAEDRWRRLRVGAVAFDVVKPCARCVVTTIDQRSGVKDSDCEPIRTLQRFRRDAGGRVLFGQNLIPRGTGTIRIGDPVEILA